MKKHYTMNEPYTVGQFDDDGYYYVFKFDVPIIHSMPILPHMSRWALNQMNLLHNAHGATRQKIRADFHRQIQI